MHYKHILVPHKIKNPHALAKRTFQIVVLGALVRLNIPMSHDSL